MSKFFCPYCKSTNQINRYTQDQAVRRDIITKFECLDCGKFWWIDREILMETRNKEKLCEHIWENMAPNNHMTCSRCGKAKW